MRNKERLPSIYRLPRNGVNAQRANFFQISLRTILIATAVIALYCGAYLRPKPAERPRDYAIGTISKSLGHTLDISVEFPDFSRDAYFHSEDRGLFTVKSCTGNSILYFTDASHLPLEMRVGYRQITPAMQKNFDKLLAIAQEQIDIDAIEWWNASSDPDNPAEAKRHFAKFRVDLKFPRATSRKSARMGAPSPAAQN